MARMSAWPRCQELQQLLKKHREDYCPGLPAAELDALAAWKVRTAQSPAASRIASYI